MPAFKLRLEDTYWTKGFFNVPADFERFLSRDDGDIDPYSGARVRAVRGRLDRESNKNGNPRIHGTKPLRDFFQNTFKPGAFALVDIGSPRAIRISKP